MVSDSDGSSSELNASEDTEFEEVTSTESEVSLLLQSSLLLPLRLRRYSSSEADELVLEL